MTRATETERAQLHETFAALCRIESPSGHERACAELVIAELRALGVRVHEDEAGVLTGTECGNLLARIPAGGGRYPDDGSTPEAPGVMLCSHMDTVRPQAPVEPVLLDGGWENANEGILGADNKAAVAVLLALARHICREGTPVDVELLFAVRQEAAQAGANAFDASRLKSAFGFAFDNSSPLGEVVVQAPGHFRVEAAFRGVTADAALRAQECRGAILAAARAIASMRLGRVDDQTTVNVGTITGGSAANAVPERCALVAEVRSLSDERSQALVTEVVDRVNQAANTPECECDVDVSVERTFAGYRTPAGTPALQTAEAALRSCGHEPVRIAAGEASIASALLAQGFATVNLASGTEHSREPGERVSVAALEGMLDIAVALLDEAAASSPDAQR